MITNPDGANVAITLLEARICQPATELAYFKALPEFVREAIFLLSANFMLSVKDRELVRCACKLAFNLNISLACWALAFESLNIISAVIPSGLLSATSTAILAASPATRWSKSPPSPDEPDSATHLIWPTVSPASGGALNPNFSSSSMMNACSSAPIDWKYSNASASSSTVTLIKAKASLVITTPLE